MTHAGATVCMIPIDQIEIANPRHRSKKAFLQLVDNISTVGLKKPITVATVGHERFRLICGQGRLEAYRVLGQSLIPAFVKAASLEDSMLMSLVENIARRQRGSWEFIQQLEVLVEHGYQDADIALKTGLSVDYVACVRRLLDRGEQRLLMSLEAGTMPISVAIEISEVKDARAQDILRAAYESGELRGRKLAAVKRVVEERRRRGKTLSWGADQSVGASVKAMMQAYEDDVGRKQSLVTRAANANSELSFIVESLTVLFSSIEFVRLMRAGGLLEMPALLAQRLKNKGIDLGTASLND